MACTMIVPWTGGLPVMLASEANRDAVNCPSSEAEAAPAKWTGTSAAAAPAWEGRTPLMLMPPPSESGVPATLSITVAPLGASMSSGWVPHWQTVPPRC